MDNDCLKQLNIFVIGRVQGVFFRDNTKAIAMNLGLTGYVRNLDGGGVEILAQGEESALRQLLDWCYRGSLLAKVEGLSFDWKEIGERTYGKFAIDKEGRGYIGDKAEAAINLTRRVIGRAERKVEKIFPKHIAIIPDGNRRWAKERGLDPWEGHKAGADRTTELIKSLRDTPITHLTFWGFSTDNWKRSEEEVKYLMQIFEYMIKKFIDSAKKYKVAFHHFGRKDRLPKNVINMVNKAEETTKQYTDRHFAIALDYGGQDDILRAINKVKDNGEEITEDIMRENLDTHEFPDPDLIIRTSGESRLSGLMSWQCKHSELYFTPLHFPDFTPAELALAIDDFSMRQRRFGGS